MKRKRGSKKGKGKKKVKPAEANEVELAVVSSPAEDDTAGDGSDNEDVDSGMDAENEKSPSPVKPVEPEKPVVPAVVSRPLDNTFGRQVYTRVKVRLKTNKNLEAAQNASSSAPAPAPTEAEKSNNQQVVPEKQERQEAPKEKIEDTVKTLPETNGGVPGNSGNTAKKSVAIKIKSSRGFGSSSMSPCSNTEPAKGDNTEKKDSPSLPQESRYNEQQLKLALEVVRKVMKMDAATPFNVPVDPVALGIPDYFDVIDTPMDFGTVCNNLEKGIKYKNAEDVFKDVQYIWDNCYKYNNKGDYIVELMKRVKKNFIKYWAAVGLFSEQPQEATDAESNPVKDGTPSSQENTPPTNSGSLSINLSNKKFHGLKKHKEGCQCAICVMMRRRQEREEIERMMGGPADGSDDSMGEDMKPEGTSHVGSPFGEYDSSNMGNSPDTDADTERKGHELKLGLIRNLYSRQKDNDTASLGFREGSQDMPLLSRDESNSNFETPHMGSGGSIFNDSRAETPMQNDQGAMIDQQNHKEVLSKNQRAKMLENLRYLDNPMLLKLSGTLFSDNSNSFWNGPHSLGSRRQGSTRKTPFHSAISSLMK